MSHFLAFWGRHLGDAKRKSILDKGRWVFNTVNLPKYTILLPPATSIRMSSQIERVSLFERCSTCCTGRRVCTSSVCKKSPQTANHTSPHPTTSDYNKLNECGDFAHSSSLLPNDVKSENQPPKSIGLDMVQEVHNIREDIEGLRHAQIAEDLSASSKVQKDIKRDDQTEADASTGVPENIQDTHDHQDQVKTRQSHNPKKERSAISNNSQRRSCDRCFKMKSKVRLDSTFWEEC